MPKFSTTTEIEQVVHELGMMSAMESYFDFKCQTDCGISKVKLMGTLDDWKKLRNHIEGLGNPALMLEWWVNGTLWIIDNIILTYQGKMNK